ncbi:MAG: threonine synthase, partial [Actinomycetota bacterium]|nr:threonine synthase [Actinomycetota bacterium]
EIVITVTGNGLKDPQWALEGANELIKVSVDAASAARELGLAN